MSNSHKRFPQENQTQSTSYCQQLKDFFSMQMKCQKQFDTESYASLEISRINTVCKPTFKITNDMIKQTCPDAFITRNLKNNSTSNFSSKPNPDDYICCPSSTRRGLKS